MCRDTRPFTRVCTDFVSHRWKAPNVIVSPHAAGGRPQRAEALIAKNMRRFLAGQELENRI